MADVLTICERVAASTLTATSKGKSNNSIDGTERRVLQAAASTLGLTFPACRGNFQIVGVPSQFGVDNVVRKLYEEGFRVRSLSQVPLLRNYFRVALGGTEIMEQFAVALRRAVC